MFVNKTPSGIAAEKTAHGQTQTKAASAKNVKAQTQAKPSPSPSAPRSISSLITASGLPADKLSASIISFARFFSLPIKPNLMAEIRRQALLPQTNTPQTQGQSAGTQDAQPESARQTSSANKLDAAGILKMREAFSLAAAAAESKGVELQQKGLEAFAEAIDPDQKRQDSGGHNREKRNKNHEQKDENSAAKTGAVSASSIEKLALESAENNPLLYILNRLPCKNGRRWIVLPFDFDEDGEKYRVSMRIMLEPGQAADHVICMALDIVQEGSAENRYAFVLEPANNQLMRLSAYTAGYFSPGDLSLIQIELSKLLQLPLDHVSVKIMKETFPCETSGEENVFQSIDEAF